MLAVTRNVGTECLCGCEVLITVRVIGIVPSLLAARARGTEEQNRGWIAVILNVKCTEIKRPTVIIQFT